MMRGRWDRDDDGDGDGSATCTCAANTDLIYVISDAAQLYSFDPTNNQFASVANLASLCAESNTFSMSVDRDGVAWIMMQSGNVYNVDVNNPTSCTNSGWTPGTGGYQLFGMGFVSNSATDQCDFLYAHSWTGSGGFSEGPNSGTLGKLDPSMLTIQTQGNINYDGGELTGNQNGQLFAFAGTNPAKLVEYDKSNATVLATTPLTGLNLTNAFAFANWKGKFYFFTESTNPTVSKVTEYDPNGPGNGLTTVVNSAPIRIVGAGVSTCAPVAT